MNSLSPVAPSSYSSTRTSRSPVSPIIPWEPASLRPLFLLLLFYILSPKVASLPIIVTFDRQEIPTSSPETSLKSPVVSWLTVPAFPISLTCTYHLQMRWWVYLRQSRCKPESHIIEHTFFLTSSHKSFLQ